MSSRGRPPKDGERYPSGDLKPVQDRGSPRAQAKRATIIDAAELLFALWQAKIISAHQYEAGRCYADLRTAVFGQPFGQTGSLDMVAEHIGATEADDTASREPMTPQERREKNIRRYFEADAALKTAGERSRRAVGEIAYERQTPDWLVGIVAALAHASDKSNIERSAYNTLRITSAVLTQMLAEMNAFRHGLDVLDAHFREGRKDRPTKMRSWRAEEAA
jgi:hypothetical protein